MGVWVPIYYVLLFIYVPFGILLAWLQPLWQSGCGGLLGFLIIPIQFIVSLVIVG